MHGYEVIICMELGGFSAKQATPDNYNNRWTGKKP